MKYSLAKPSAGALFIAAAHAVHAQYAPPPPPAPFQGFLNEWLRKDDPYMNKWDFGGSVRVRYESKDNFAVAGSGAGATTSLDFRKNGANVDNAYLLERIRVRAGYTDKWFSALVEGRPAVVPRRGGPAASARPPPRGRRPGRGVDEALDDLGARLLRPRGAGNLGNWLH